VVGSVALGALWLGDILTFKRRFRHSGTHEATITMSTKTMGNQPPNGQSQDNASKPGSGRTSKDLGHRDPVVEDNANKSSTIAEESEESSMFSGLDVNDGDGDRDTDEKEESSGLNQLPEESDEEGNGGSMFEYAFN